MKAYRRAGVPVDALTLQNEPQNRFPFEYPGMDFRDQEEARLVETVGPALQARAAGHQAARLRPQLVAAPQRRRTARRGQPGVRQDLLDDPRRAPLARRHRLPLLLGRPRGPVRRSTTCTRTRTSTSPSAPARSPRIPATTFADTLQWHTRIPDRRRGAQLGQDGDHLERRAGSRGRPAQRRLRHLHRRRDDRPAHGRGHARGRLLRARPRHEVRAARARGGSTRRSRARSRTSRSATRAARSSWWRSTTTGATARRASTCACGGREVSYDLPAGAVATFTL